MRHRSGGQQETDSSVFVLQIYTYLKETHSKLQMSEAPLLSLGSTFPGLTHAALSRREDEAWSCAVTSVIDSRNDEF